MQKMKYFSRRFATSFCPFSHKNYIFFNFLTLIFRINHLHQKNNYNYCKFYVNFLIIIMDNSQILKEIQSIQKEDFCEKQSRFWKSWRKRWIVLTNNLLLTYKQRRVYQSPTEVIELKEVVSIKTCDQEHDKKNVFKIETNETTFFFACQSSLEKEQWIGAIGKAMVKRNNRDLDD